MHDIFEYSNGEKGLQKAVNRLNGNIKGHVSAILEGGVATSVIIWDLIENDVITGSDTFEDAETPAAATIDYDMLEVTELVTVDGNFKTPISENLKAHGLKVTGWTLAGATPAAGDKVTAVDKDGNEYTFDLIAPTTEHFSVTVDDKVVEYVESGDDAKLVVKDIKGKGTGYETNAGAAAAYADYSTTSTTSVAASISKAIVIKTGYIEVKGLTTAATTTGGATDGATGGTVACATATTGYAEVGSDITVTVTLTANTSATKGSVVSVTVTGATAPDSQDATVDQAKAATKFTFTIKAGETKITAIGGNVCDAT